MIELKLKSSDKAIQSMMSLETLHVKIGNEIDVTDSAGNKSVGIKNVHNQNIEILAKKKKYSLIP